MKLNEVSPLGARRNLSRAAQDWIETNPGEIAAISHFWDTGDEKTVRNYLARIIKDDNLLHAVLNKMFRVPEEVEDEAIAGGGIAMG